MSTFEEASDCITEAIALYIESLQADHQPILENHWIVRQVCVSI
jgi:predicted RNase H-like HicB family nuclease